MFKKEKTLLSAADGRIIPLSEVPDEVFSGKILGEGYAVIPTKGEVFAPIGGVMLEVAESGHAYSIGAKGGEEVLIHIGIDTVSLQGEGFTPMVAKGETVVAGQLLAKVDLAFLEEKELCSCIPVVITNSNEFRSIKLLPGNGTGGITPALSYNGVRMSKH